MGSYHSADQKRPQEQEKKFAEWCLDTKTPPNMLKITRVGFGFRVSLVRSSPFFEGAVLHRSLPLPTAERIQRNSKTALDIEHAVLA